MAETIVAVASTSKNAQYTLPEEIRQALLKRTTQRRHKRAALIEQQRKAFIDT